LVGFLSGRSPAEAAGVVAAFRKGLSEIGFVEPQNVTIDFRWAEGQFDRLPALARELVDRPVAVIAALGGSDIAAKAATTTIPIVFGTGAVRGCEGPVNCSRDPGAPALLLN
jgi:putative ABC transport system substrate-binding protein